MTTFIFDFDGTLADTLGAIVSAFNKENNSKKIGLDELSTLHNLPTGQIIKRLKISVLRLPLLLRKIKLHLKNEIPSSPPFPNIDTTLCSLKKQGHNIGILTSNSIENVNTYIKYYNLEKFDFIYTERALFKKARTLRKLLKQQNVDPKNAIYVGDETRDIEAAQLCSVRSAAVTWGLHSKNLLKKFSPDFIIETPEELLKIS